MLNSGLHQQAIDHDFDGVVLPLVEVNDAFVVQADQLAIDAGARITVLDERLHLFFEFAFAAPDNRSHDHDPIFRRQRHHPLHNLVGGLPADRASALGTMRHSDRSE